MRAHIASFTICLIFVMLAMSIQSVGASGDMWILRRPMPNADLNLGAVSINGEIYVIGHNFTYVFNPNTDTWISKTPMPSNRQGFAIAAYQNKIYVIGGWNSVDPKTGIAITLGTNEIYDPATDTWTNKASMPTPTANMEANEVEGKIYVIGGMTDISKPTVTSTNWVYDPSDNSWSTAEPIPTPVFDYASAVLNGRIYVEGGGLSGSPYYTDSNQIYDPKTNTWVLGQPLPVNVHGSAAEATTGVLASAKLYVIGGTKDGFNGVNTTQIYDPQTDQWAFGAQMSTARLLLSVAALNDSLYALGGESYAAWNVQVSSEIYSTNEQYIPLDYQGALPTPYVPTPSPHSTNMPKPTTSPTPPNSGPTSSPSASQTPMPTINTGPEQPQSEPFPPIVIAVVVFVAGVLGISLLMYKNKHKSS